MRPGQIERRTQDYVRHGTPSLFTALELKTGAVFGECHRRHRSFADDILASIANFCKRTSDSGH